MNRIRSSAAVKLSRVAVFAFLIFALSPSLSRAQALAAKVTALGYRYSCYVAHTATGDQQVQVLGFNAGSLPAGAPGGWTVAQASTRYGINFSSATFAGFIAGEEMSCCDPTQERILTVWRALSLPGTPTAVDVEDSRILCAQGSEIPVFLVYAPNPVAAPPPPVVAPPTPPAPPKPVTPPVVTPTCPYTWLASSPAWVCSAMQQLCTGAHP